MKRGGFPGEHTQDGSALVIKDHLNGMNYIRRNNEGPEICDAFHYEYGETLFLKSCIKAEPMLIYCTLLNYMIEYDRVIVILRNPASAALAEFNRAKTNKHASLLPTNRFKGSAWPNFIKSFLNNWKRMNK